MRPILSVVTTGARLVHDLQQSIEEVKRRRVHEQLDLLVGLLRFDLTRKGMLATNALARAADQRMRSATREAFDDVDSAELADLPFR